MRTKQIAGEEYLVFSQIGEHCLWPVNPGGMDKLQGSISQRHGLLIVDGDEFLFRDKE